jgi:hypothetical protein
MFTKMIAFVFVVVIALPFAVVGYLTTWAVGGFRAGRGFWVVLHGDRK